MVLSSADIIFQNHFFAVVVFFNYFFFVISVECQAVWIQNARWV